MGSFEWSILVKAGRKARSSLTRSARCQLGSARSFSLRWHGGGASAGNSDGVDVDADASTGGREVVVARKSDMREIACEETVATASSIE